MLVEASAGGGEEEGGAVANFPILRQHNTKTAGSKCSETVPMSAISNSKQARSGADCPDKCSLECPADCPANSPDDCSADCAPGCPDNSPDDCSADCAPGCPASRPADSTDGRIDRYCEDWSESWPASWPFMPSVTSLSKTYYYTIHIHTHKQTNNTEYSQQ